MDQNVKIDKFQSQCAKHCAYNTVEPPNNESVGTANFFHYLEVFFIERYKSIEVYANGTLEKFPL